MNNDLETVLAALKAALPSLGPRMRRAAVTVLDWPGAVVVQSMRSLAGSADVSPPTMLRLAQKLGYPNYGAFQDVFKNSITSGGYLSRAKTLHAKAGKDGVEGVIEQTVSAVASGLNRFTDPAFGQSVEAVADLILQSRRVLLVAAGSNHGMAVSFHYICRMAVPGVEIASLAGNAPLDGVTGVRPGDLALGVTVDPYARSTVSALEAAKENGAKVAAVTDRHSSPAARLADESILVETVATHYFPSLSGVNTALEILSAVVAIKAGPAAMRSIDAFDRALKKYRVYWEEGK